MPPTVMEIMMTIKQDRRPRVGASRLSRRTTLRLIAAVPLVGVAATVDRARGFDRSVAGVRPTAATPAATGTDCAASPTTGGMASPTGSPTPAATMRMTTQLRFAPDHVTIKVGETISWFNDSTMPHTATGDLAQNPVATSHPQFVRLPDGAQPWGSKLLQPSQSYSHTFMAPGEYNYICIPHVLSGMRGTISVEC
jgi:plastocyanin